ncbi:hypothetical protein [Paramaledivibacter caminithermalis]|jgi:hypothetical protein|uniref:hypothetical protein n=1 Tax=Paramaledivibacter caminithermalis TaxID=191027 RepID=UPI0013F4DA34|nr:hypothetical protein [Paramaledivibacter caminithermalis]
MMGDLVIASANIFKTDKVADISIEVIFKTCAMIRIYGYMLFFSYKNNNSEKKYI